MNQFAVTSVNHIPSQATTIFNKCVVDDEICASFLEKIDVGHLTDG